MKPPISEDAVMNDDVFFYTALDFKRVLGIESSLIKGSSVFGFLVGKGMMIPVYKTYQLLQSFGSHEALVPEYIRRYFHIFADSAILICDDTEAVVDISNQLIRGISYDKKNRSMNTAQYQHFYVLPSDDSFLSHYNDLYADHTETEQRIVREYNIDISDTDKYGNPRIVVGTGYIESFPALVYAGNVDVVSLEMFILDAEYCSQDSYIFCTERDAEALKRITKGTPVRVITI
ncbi:MAG: hypothetical protein IJH07_09250 [Ruminococcus sp.]|nr:hypothetical protein [Ruminococcus sp.]